MLAPWSSRGGGGRSTHGFTFEFEPVYVVNEAIQEVLSQTFAGAMACSLT